MLRLLLQISVFLVPILIILPTLLPPGWRQMVFLAFEQVCHQLPDRTFHVHGLPLAVCQRCFGVYVGLAAAMLVWPFVRQHADALGRSTLAVLAAGTVPLGIDWALTVLGVWQNTPFTRTATGLLFGLVAGAVLARALDNLYVSPPLAQDSAR
jgi:uncharacterized membrane protein